MTWRRSEPLGDKFLALVDNMEMSREKAVDFTSVEDDAIKICQELIRIPSVNFGEGKGDEAAVADYIVKCLAEVGIESKIYD